LAVQSSQPTHSSTLGQMLPFLVLLAAVSSDAAACIQDCVLYSLQVTVPQILGRDAAPHSTSGTTRRCNGRPVTGLLGDRQCCCFDENAACSWWCAGDDSFDQQVSDDTTLACTFGVPGLVTGDDVVFDQLGDVIPPGKMEIALIDTRTALWPFDDELAQPGNVIPPGGMVIAATGALALAGTGCQETGVHCIVLFVAVGVGPSSCSPSSLGPRCKSWGLPAINHPLAAPMTIATSDAPWCYAESLERQDAHVDALDVVFESDPCRDIQDYAGTCRHVPDKTSADSVRRCCISCFTDLVATSRTPWTL